MLLNAPSSFVAGAVAWNEELSQIATLVRSGSGFEPKAYEFKLQVGAGGGAAAELWAVGQLCASTCSRARHGAMPAVCCCSFSVDVPALIRPSSLSLPPPRECRRQTAVMPRSRPPPLARPPWILPRWQPRPAWRGRCAGFGRDDITPCGLTMSCMCTAGSRQAVGHGRHLLTPCTCTAVSCCARRPRCRLRCRAAAPRCTCLWGPLRYDRCFFYTYLRDVAVA